MRPAAAEAAAVRPAAQARNLPIHEGRPATALAGKASSEADLLKLSQKMDLGKLPPEYRDLVRDIIRHKNENPGLSLRTDSGSPGQVAHALSEQTPSVSPYKAQQAIDLILGLLN